MRKSQLIIISILGALAVGMGAFGAHALEPRLIETGYLDTYETGVKYHFYHVIAALVILLLDKSGSRWTAYAVNAFIAGIVIFSGSLYVLSLSGIGILGAITPVGGVLFISGWLFLIPYARRLQD